jgi:hypothetical protein
MLATKRAVRGETTVVLVRDTNGSSVARSTRAHRAGAQAPGEGSDTNRRRWAVTGLNRSLSHAEHVRRFGKAGHSMERSLHSFVRRAIGSAQLRPCRVPQTGRRRPSQSDTGRTSS